MRLLLSWWILNVCTFMHTEAALTICVVNECKKKSNYNESSVSNRHSTHMSACAHTHTNKRVHTTNSKQWVFKTRNDRVERAVSSSILVRQAALPVHRLQKFITLGKRFKKFRGVFFQRLILVLIFRSIVQLKVRLCFIKKTI